MMGAHQRIGGRPLHEGAGFVVDLGAEEIVRRGVADLELDRWVELYQLDEVGVLEIACFGWRRCRQCFRPKRLDGTEWRNPQLIRTGLRLDIAPRAGDTRRARFRCPSRAVARKHDSLAIVQAVRWKGECVARNGREW